MRNRDRIKVGLAATATVLLLNYCAPLNNDRMFRDPSPKSSTTTTDLHPVDSMPHKGAVCQEDDECWDCHADGNGICGTDLGG